LQLLTLFAAVSVIAVIAAVAAIKSLSHVVAVWAAVKPSLVLSQSPYCHLLIV
jgi:hypothetical protein